MSGNAFIAWLLRSPLHGMVSKSLMLVTFTGRKSGKTYTTPVNYLRRDGALWTTSLRSRVWWRSLAGGAAATLRLQGKDVAARGDVLLEESAVAEALAQYFRAMPQAARYFNLRLDEAGNANPTDLARLAAERVMIRFKL
ncbi:MAG: nitroreductase/quinone reductase family protein [Chloroflexi bacterium]|nr:nitroreductase/quinone reductase family protein [Chloroflexota bacterium]